jgi:methyl-accepting chemotaxis protein
MNKIKGSLMFKIILMCVGLVLFSSITMRFLAYNTARDEIKDTMGQTALNITRSAISFIDPEKFNGLQTADDMESEYYLELRNKLNEIKSYTGLKYLYTMRRTADGDYIYVVDGMNLEEASLLGDIDNDMSSSMKKCFNGQEGYDLDIGNSWGDLATAYVPIENDSGETIGILAADIDAGYMVEHLKKANRNMMISAVVIALISILLAAVFSYYMVRSLKYLQTKILRVKDGDLTVKIENNRKDEVGNLSRSFQSMIVQITSMIQNIRSNTELVVINIDSLNNNMDVSNKAAEEITNIMNVMAEGSIKQVDKVTNVSDSMENVFHEIQSIMEYIELVNNDSDKAMKDMKRASEILKGSVKQINLVNDTVDITASMMKQLETKFQQVLSFSDSVSAIAKQTNLLALNASIEAASAGEHGKGFAVVAKEINKLARLSGDASNRIQDLIHMVQEEIVNSSISIENGVVEARNGVKVISQVDTYLEMLSDSNQKVDKRIKEIAKAITNIEQDSKKVLDNTNQLEEISKDFSAGTQQTAAGEEEQLAYMEEIRNNLIMVKELMEQLNKSVNQFNIDE